MTDNKPYAVIQLAGKQYTVSAGDKLTTNRLDTEEGNEIKINDVLLYVDGDKRKIGTPLVKDATVALKVVSNHRGDKIRVATYKAKSRYRKVKGHKQHQTTVEVLSIKA